MGLWKRFKKWVIKNSNGSERKYRGKSINSHVKQNTGKGSSGKRSSTEHSGGGSRGGYSSRANRADQQQQKGKQYAQSSQYQAYLKRVRAEQKKKEERKKKKSVDFSTYYNNLTQSTRPGIKQPTQSDYQNLQKTKQEISERNKKLKQQREVQKEKEKQEKARQRRDAVRKAIQQSQEEAKNSDLLSTSESIELQNANRSSGNTYVSQSTKDKFKRQVARNNNSGSTVNNLAHGFMNGSAFGMDLTQATARNLGVRVNNDKQKATTAYKAGEFLGYLVPSTFTGAAFEGTLAKGAAKGIAKMTGKKTVGKGGKFVADRAAEAASSLPVNVIDAAATSKDKKEFAENMGKNALLDAGFGTALDAVGGIAKGIKHSKEIEALGDALVAKNRGKNLTAKEKVALKKVTKTPTAKKVVKGLKNGTYKNASTVSEKKVTSHDFTPKIRSEDVRKAAKAYVTGDTETIKELADAAERKKKKTELKPVSSTDVGPVPTALKTSTTLNKTISDSEVKNNGGTKKESLKSGDAWQPHNEENMTVENNSNPSPSALESSESNISSSKVKSNSEVKNVPDDFTKEQKEMASKAYVKYVRNGDIETYNRIVSNMETLNKEKKYVKYKDKSAIKVDNTHSDSDIKRINDYLGSVNEKLLQFVKKVHGLKDKNVASKLDHELHPVQTREAEFILKNLDMDVSDYRHNLNGSSINHIDSRHGKNGAHDHTMAIEEDIARVQNVLQNYDDLEVLSPDDTNGLSKAWTNSDQTPAKIIRYNKKVDGKYYVAEAVPDSSRKRLQIISCYMDTKKEAPQLLNMPKDPQPTSETLVASASTDTIPDTASKSNTDDKIITKDGLIVDEDGVVVGETTKPDSVDIENDPAVKEILSDPNNPKQTVDKKSLKDRFIDMKDVVRRRTVDSLQGIEKMGRKMGGEMGEILIAQASALRRAAEKANFNIMHKQTDFNNKVIGKGALEIIAPIKKQGKEAYNDFNAYIFHKLNIDRYRNGKSLWGKDVVPPEKSAEIIRQLEEKYPDFKVSAEETVQFFRNHNTLRVQSGMIAEDTKDLLEELYENYVPAYRNIDRKAAKTDSDAVRVDTGVRKAKGGDQDILPIFEQMVYTTQQTWKNAELNETISQIAHAQTLDPKYIAKEVLEKSDPEDALDEMLNRSVFFKEGKGDTVTAVYFERGVPRECQISRLIYDGLKDWTPQDKHVMLNSGAFDHLENMVKSFNETKAGKVTISANNIFKALITSYNPAFLIRNFAKDIQDVPINASNFSGFVKNMPKAFHSMMKSINGEKDALWEAYLATGSRYSGLIDPKKALDPTGRAAKLKKVNPLSYLETANMAVEAYPRFVEFVNILDQRGVKNIQDATRVDLELAAKGAADITCDFGRSGSLTAPLNRSAVPFLNASIQGTDKLLRVLAGQKGVRGYVGLLGKLTVLGATPAVAQEIIYANNPDYQQLNARDKAGNWFIPDDDGIFWKIPRGRSISSITNPVQQIARQFVGNDKISFDEFVHKVVTDVAPVNPWDSHFLAQVFNTMANRTWCDYDIEGWSDRYNEDGTEKPKVERYDPNTSKIGIALSEKTNAALKKIFGEETAEKLTFSPMQIDYLLDSYGGIASDVVLSGTKLGRTKPVLTDVFDRNFKKDSVYSNNLAENFYDKQDELKKFEKDQNASIEDRAKAKMLGITSGNLNDLRTLRDQIRYDKNMSMDEKAGIDRAIQKQINSQYRSGIDEKAIKVFNDFVSKHKGEYMSEKGLISAAQQQHEKVTHSTVNAMDTLYKYGGMKAVLKGKSYWTDDDEKQPWNYSNDKTIGKIYKGYKASGGKDEDFYQLYREMTKANKERGIGTNSDYSNLAAVILHTSKKLGSKGRLKKAFGVTKESEALVKEYFSTGGSKAEYMKAASLVDNGANSLVDKQKDGKKKTFNHDAPFNARSLAGFSDRVYRVMDSAKKKRRTEHYVNNSRGLAHYNISLKTLQELDNKCAKDDKDGFNTREGVEKVLDKTKYSREEKALLWEALYGNSYSEVNPYGSIRKFSLKSDVGLSNSSGWVDYGNSGRRNYYRRYRRYARSYGNGQKSSPMLSFEEWLSQLDQKNEMILSDHGKSNSGSTEAKRKAVTKAVAKSYVSSKTPSASKAPTIHYDKLKSFNTKATSQQKALLKALLKSRM